MKDEPTGLCFTGSNAPRAEARWWSPRTFYVSPPETRPPWHNSSIALSHQARRTGLLFALWCIPAVSTYTDWPPPRWRLRTCRSNRRLVTLPPTPHQCSVSTWEGKGSLGLSPAFQKNVFPWITQDQFQVHATKNCTGHSRRTGVSDLQSSEHRG